MEETDRQGGDAMQILSAAQMRGLDRIAIEKYEIPSVQLMERAARALTGVVCRHAPSDGGRAAIFCGPGNNGGDGVACARFLHQRGLSVRAFLVGKREKMTDDCREMERRLEDSGCRLEDFTDHISEAEDWSMTCDVIVDAIFGIGLNTDVRGEAAEAIRLMEHSSAPVVAADIASGIEADTGRILGTAVRAAQTVTFTRPKIGHFAGKGGVYTGALSVADIGIPQELVETVQPVAQSVERVDLPRRPRDAHKGDFGKLLILAGGVGYTGAPVLSAQAAVRTGAGLVTVAVPEAIYPIVAVKCDSAMPRPLPSGPDGMLSAAGIYLLLRNLEGKTAVLAGPGLGRSDGVSALVGTVLEKAACPVVLDADGINAISGHIDRLDRRRGLTVLTPHDGEFVRLGGDISDGDRVKSAKDFSFTHHCVLVLKGHNTITAFPDGAVFLNTTGNPGMAKGGSGDVLAGMIAALLGQGLDPKLAVPGAVWLHGRTGDLCAQELGEYGMTPADLIAYLPEVTKAF